MSAITLRPYQRDCLVAAAEDYRAGSRRQLWVLPCGAGKTAIASCLPPVLNKKPGDQTLFIVPFDDLVWQAKRAMEWRNRGMRVQVEKAEYVADKDSDIIIASYQTLAKVSKSGQRDRLKNLDPNRIQAIVIDEAHFAMAESFQHILRHLRVLKGEADCDDSKLLVGISATPNRSDSVGLEGIFDKITYNLPLRTLMQTGPTIHGKLYPYLAPPKVWRVNTEVDLSKVRSSKGEFMESDLSHYLDTDQRNALIVQKYREMGEGLPAVCFTVNVAHSEHMAEEFNKQGVVAAAVSGDTPRAARDKIYSAYASGYIKVLASCQVLSTGWDRPEATVALMARPYRSSLPYIQSIGRVFRPCPSPEEYYGINEAGGSPRWIKQYSIAIDFCDNTGRHDIQTVPSLFGLSPRFDMQGKDALKTASEAEEIISKGNQKGLDLRSCYNLDEAKTQIEQVDLWQAPQVPSHVKKLSKNIWIQTQEGVIQLSVKQFKLEVRENALGKFEVWKSRDGMRSFVHVGLSLEEAIEVADRNVPAEDLALVNSSLKWRREAPSEPQAKLLWLKDENIKKQFPSGKDFYVFAVRQHNSGNKNFSRGGISLMLDQAFSGEKK